MAYPDQKTEMLGSEIKINVTPRHRFGTDAFLLSHFSAVRAKDLAADFCTGCGIVALLWFRPGYTAPKAAHCIEIQEEPVRLLADTIADNALEDRVFSHRLDLKDLAALRALGEGRFDVITCNPPYKSAGSGILSTSSADIIARHETECTLSDVCAAAALLLKYGGRFCICQRPERLADIFCALRGAGMEPKRMRFVRQRPGAAPWLVLVEAKKGAAPFLSVEDVLTVEGESGFSDEMLKIYGKIRRGAKNG